MSFNSIIIYYFITDALKHGLYTLFYSFTIFYDSFVLLKEKFQPNSTSYSLTPLYH